MPFFRNSKGKIFRSGIGGTYPVNDGNPENEVEGFDEDQFNNAQDDADEAIDIGY